MAIAFRQIVSRSRGHLVVEPARRPRLVLQHLQQQHPPVAAERQLAGQQLVEDDAEAVDVAAGVDPVRLAAGLLGAHVGRRAQHLAVEGHRRLVGLALGQAEVHQVRPAVVVEHDVRRLDVAVDDAVVVGVVQGLGDLGDQLGRVAERDRPVPQPVGQGLALDELLDQVARAVVGLADLVEGDDAGVL